MSACIFCEIVAGSRAASVIHRDKVVTVFMDIQPVNPGHMLVVPNTHASYLANLPEDTGTQMFRVAQRMAAALQKSGVRCEGVNFFLADGEAAMQEVFHVHLHIFPRFSGDGFSLKFSEGYFTKPARSQLDTIADMIRTQL